MGSDTMGRVLVAAKIENNGDVYNFEQGLITAEQIRSVDVSDALVDTGATYLSIPTRLIQQLGLHPVRARRARTSAGPVNVQVFSAVRLTVQDRDCVTEVSEVPDD